MKPRNIADRVTGGLLGSDGAKSLFSGAKDSSKQASIIAQNAAARLSPNPPTTGGMYGNGVPNHVATDALKSEFR